MRGARSWPDLVKVAVRWGEARGTGCHNQNHPKHSKPPQNTAPFRSDLVSPSKHKTPHGKRCCYVTSLLLKRKLLKCRVFPVCFRPPAPAAPSARTMDPGHRTRCRNVLDGRRLRLPHCGFISRAQGHLADSPLRQQSLAHSRCSTN